MLKKFLVLVILISALTSLATSQRVLQVESVSVETSGSQVAQDETLELTADAEGDGLNRLVIFSSEDGRVFEKVKQKQCSGSGCSLDANFRAPDTGTYYFKADASAGEDNQITEDSEVKSVEFFDGDPSVSLNSPDGDGPGARLRPRYSWEVNDRDDSAMEDARVVVERRYNPFGWTEAASYSAQDGVPTGAGRDVSFRPSTADLEHSESYRWYVEVEDGSDGVTHSSGKNYFETKSRDIRECGVSASSLEAVYSQRQIGIRDDASLSLSFELENSVREAREVSYSASVAGAESSSGSAELDPQSSTTINVEDIDPTGFTGRKTATVVVSSSDSECGGYSEILEKSFQTKERINRIPDIRLNSPDGDGPGARLRPRYSWEVEDPENSIRDIELVVESSSRSFTYSSDETGIQALGGTQSFRPGSADLQYDTEYDWRLKVYDGGDNEPHVSDTESFRTKTDDSPECRLSLSSVEAPDSIESGEAFEASTSLDNQGGEVDFSYEVTADGSTLDSGERKAGSGSGEVIRQAGIDRSDDADGDGTIMIRFSVQGESAPCGRFSRTVSKSVEVERGPVGRNPSVDLSSPRDNAAGVPEDPSFVFSVTDDGSRLDRVELYVEEKTGPGDEPWQSYRDEQVIVEDVTSRGSIQGGSEAFQARYSVELSEQLQNSEEYVWGVEAEDTDGNVDRSSVRTFTVREESRGAATENFRIVDEGYRDLQNGRKRLFVELGSNPDRGVCRWKRGYGINPSNSQVMAKPDGGQPRWEATASFDTDRRVVFRCYDGSGNAITGFESINVDAGQEDSGRTPGDTGNSAPDADLDVSPRTGSPGKKFTFDASGSSDVDGSIARYRWDFDGDGVYDRTTDDSDFRLDRERKRIFDEGRKVARVRVVDDNGATDVATDIYDVERTSSPPPSGNEKPSVSLLRPEDGETDVSVDPTPFEWRVSDSDDSQMYSVDLFVERKDYNGDVPWDNGRRISVSRSTGYSSKNVYGLENDEVYVWGVEADDGSSVARSSVYDFRTAEAGSGGGGNGGDGTGECGLSAGSLQVSDRNIEAGDSVDVSLEVSNSEASQRVRVAFESGGDVLRQDDVALSGSRTFSETISPDEDSAVTATVETIGGDCGDRTVATRSASVDVDGDFVGEEAELDVDVEDEDGEDLDAYVSVDGPEEDTRRTFDDGGVDFMLEPGEYDVAAYKDAYSSEEEEVELDPGESESIDFELERTAPRIELVDAEVPAEVCRGRDLSVDVRVRNNGPDEDVVITLRSSGSVTSQQASLEEHSTETRTLSISDFDSIGTTDVRVEVSNSETDEVVKTVESVDCRADTSEEASGITLDVVPSEVSVGSSVRASGFVDGTRSSQVDVQVGSETVARTSTTSRGYYRTTIQPRQVGQQTVRVRSGGRTAFTRLMVLPTVNVGSVDAPRKKFESEVFEVCADVNSQVAPLVTLIRDGERIDSKTAKGEVCFDTEATNPGEHEYEVLASSYGVQSSQSSSVEVLEQGSEVESFPGKVATVRSGDGLVRVQLYNTGDDVRSYDVSVDGVPDDWFEVTDAQLELAKGERETAYFYLTPEAEGRFSADVSVERSGVDVYSTQVSIDSGGTTETRTAGLIGGFRSLIRS